MMLMDGRPLGFALATATVVASAALALRRRGRGRDGVGADPLAADPSIRKKAIAKKERLRNAAKKARCEQVPNGLPEGQTLASKWVILDLGLRPAPGSYSLEPSAWRLSIVLPGGACATLTMADVQELGISTYADRQWHCVTGWSATGLSYDGVPLSRVLAHPKVLAAAGSEMPHWTWLLQRSADGYSVPVLLEDAMADDALLALGFDGEPITMEHGGPRLVLPALYGWKSAKWMVEIELLEGYQAGFWEIFGCHARGRHGFNERFSEGLSSASARAWAWMGAATGSTRTVGGYGSDGG
ncbi:Oxidoreductase, molybdopterin-binding domain-containing protein [Pavlovales sp. CCMP2436]|nr:Oxidoreductase, molybdopterin-binding domain-containing protein [Pavlovales sp. CCMP2436]